MYSKCSIAPKQSIRTPVPNKCTAICINTSCITNFFFSPPLHTRDVEIIGVHPNYFEAVVSSDVRTVHCEVGVWIYIRESFKDFKNCNLISF